MLLLSFFFFSAIAPAAFCPPHPLACPTNTRERDTERENQLRGTVVSHSQLWRFAVLSVVLVLSPTSAVQDPMTEVTKKR